MNKAKLIESINENQELLQDLTQNEFLQNNFLGMLRNIEKIIPEDSRYNFYTNLKTLRIKFTDEAMLEQQQGGAYFRNNNEIIIDKKMLNIIGKNLKNDSIEIDDDFLMILYHELIHMASTTIDENGGVSGFQNIVKTKEGDLLYSDILEGMTEGLTEYLTLLAFGKKESETMTNYDEQINIIKRLSNIVGLETMKKTFFDNINGMQDIEEALEKIDEKKSHVDLYMSIENNYKYKPGDELFDEFILSGINKRLLTLSQVKADKSKPIKIEQIEKITQNIKISDINKEYAITQSEVQENNKKGLEEK